MGGKSQWRDCMAGKRRLLILTHVNILMKNYQVAGRFHPDRDKLTNHGLLQKINFNVSMEEWLGLWDACARFFRRRRYITCGWIIQGLAVTRSILMLCGKHELPWG